MLVMTRREVLKGLASLPLLGLFRQGKSDDKSKGKKKGHTMPNGLLNGLVDYISPVAGVMTSRVLGATVTPQHTTGNSNPVVSGNHATFDGTNYYAIPSQAAYNQNTEEDMCHAVLVRFAGSAPALNTWLFAKMSNNWEWGLIVENDAIANYQLTGPRDGDWTTYATEGPDDLPHDEDILLFGWYIAATKNMFFQAFTSGGAGTIYTANNPPDFPHIPPATPLGVTEDTITIGADAYSPPDGIDAALIGNAGPAVMWKGTIPNATQRAQFWNNGNVLDLASFDNGGGGNVLLASLNGGMQDLIGGIRG